MREIWARLWLQTFTPRPQTWQEAERQRSTCCLNTADAPGEPAATKPAGNQHRPE